MVPAAMLTQYRVPVGSQWLSVHRYVYYVDPYQKLARCMFLIPLPSLSLCVLCLIFPELVLHSAYTVIE